MIPSVPRSTSTPPNAPLPTAKRAGSLVALRTMKNDMEEAMRRQNETLVSIALAEEKKRAVERAQKELAQSQQPTAQQETPGRRLNRFVVLLGVILFLAGLGLGAYLYINRTPSATPPSTEPIVTPENPEPTPPPPPPPQQLIMSLIPAHTERQFVFGNQVKEKIFTLIAEDRRMGLAESSIKNLLLEEEIPPGTPQTITALRLLSKLDTPIPDILAKTLELPFMVGLIGETNDVATPFMVLKVGDKNRGFAGMLALEANLPKIFDKIFGTTFAPQMTAKNKFHNIITNGVDTRILETSTGGLGYLFADPSTIIIAGSKSSLSTLLELAQK